MRQTSSLPVQLEKLENNTFYLHGPDQENVRLSVLDHNLIRVQVYPDGTPRLSRTWTVGASPLEGRPRDDHSIFSLPSFQHALRDDVLELTTQSFSFKAFLRDFRIEWGDFASDTRSRAYAYDKAGRGIFHYMARREDEYYYGLGEKSGELNKYGRRFVMRNTDAIGYNAETSDPLYKHIPFYITFVPDQNIAYGLFYDNLSTTVFDMGAEIDGYHGYYRQYFAEDGDLDYYFIYGPTIREVVEKYTALTGRIALPPKWSLGFLGSTMTYTEADNAQEQLKQFVDLCDAHDIPCDMFHLSSGYTTGKDGLRYVFNWNRDRIPQPEMMVKYFLDHGIHLCANIKPYFLKSHPRYSEIPELAIQSPDGNGAALTQLWSGGAFEVGQGAYMDFTNRAAIDWWKAQVKEHLLDYGIDSTWNDNNEYQLWDDDAVCDGFGDSIQLGMIRPLQSLLMTRASFEAQQEFLPDIRPFVLCRSGAPGIQKYAQVWSGDNATSWHTLKYNIPMGLGMSLSGLANVGHDVGGFFGPKPSVELFVRWIQCGVFHPRFTIHSYNTDGTINEPWMYPEVLPIVRKWMQFRYRLLPYLYTLFHEAAEHGTPLIRPLVYDFPHDANTHELSFQFMLGEQLLVAPVYEDGARQWSVYLPDGANWYDFYTGEVFRGGQTVNAAAPLDRIPLFAREGAIIPMGKPMRHVGVVPDDLREVLVFSHHDGAVSHFTLIEDDGLTINSPQTRVRFEVNVNDGELNAAVSVQGDFPLPYDEIKFCTRYGHEKTVKL
ncbi:MAG: alpha-glucosidase [Chloroflexi bacterium]|nr:alpha-glucosidase [Chloroflexota bacterium]